MVLALNRGNAYVKRDGEGYSAIKISIFVRTINLAAMVELVLILDRVVTPVAVLQDSMVLTAKYRWMIAQGTLV